jgi:hypothetical protein
MGLVDPIHRLIFLNNPQSLVSLNFKVTTEEKNVPYFIFTFYDYSIASYTSNESIATGSNFSYK